MNKCDAMYLCNKYAGVDNIELIDIGITCRIYPRGGGV